MRLDEKTKTFITLPRHLTGQLPWVDGDEVTLKDLQAFLRGYKAPRLYLLAKEKKEIYRLFLDSSNAAAFSSNPYVSREEELSRHEVFLISHNLIYGPVLDICSEVAEKHSQK